MKKREAPTLLIVVIAIVVVGYFLIGTSSFDLPEGEAVKVSDSSQNGILPSDDGVAAGSSLVSSREISETEGVLHNIDIDEIKQGCLGRDCIRSVDDPKFVSVKEADKVFRTAGESPQDVVGIALSHNGVNRFYPFNMLVTREIVNDEVGGEPVAITYCPLCGTGIVFSRLYGNDVLEFGVSGLLWQSNLLMYNRVENEEDISLWSQVLGEAVLGSRTGSKLTTIPSDVMLFSVWAEDNLSGEVLNTGRIGDPYGGDYYGVAKSFSPNFNEENSPISPTEYVFGIEIDGKFKAYVRESIELGATDDEFNGLQLRIDKGESGIVRIVSGETQIPVVSGFWFSWVSAHPETELYK